MLYEDIHTHATGEFLAKKDEYSQGSLEYYLDQAHRYLAGETAIVPEYLHDSIAIQGLMLRDKEDEVTALYPELERVYADSDAFQIASTRGAHNLDFLLEHGITYEFDGSQLERASNMIREDVPMSVSLMREKIVRASGFDGVRVNYIYHDVMDHVWLFQFMRDKAIAAKYDDYVQAIGDPFQGSLMSRESELFSGIGFTSRRYLSDPSFYGEMTINVDEIADFMLMSSHNQDQRISEAIGALESNPEVAEWSGYVIKAATSNLLAQREKWGAVKELVKDGSGDFVGTSSVVSLLDARYMAIIIDTISELATNKEEYINAQRQLNRKMEEIISGYIRTGKAVGAISVTQAMGQAETTEAEAIDDIGLSTNYF